MAEKTKVLFLCTGNSCRSQMAEGFARALHPDTLEAYSAGIEPHGLNPLAVRAMQEIGIDISAHKSRHLNDLSEIDFDVVVTVCDHANETCPTLPGNVRRMHVAFDDPPKLARDAPTDELAMPHYRRVRDEIKAFVRRLPEVIEKEAR